MFIADISDGNPNVMYELGYAHALKKPVLPLVRRGTGQIPSDLSGYLYFSYDPDNLHELVAVVTQWIERNRSGKKEI
jgi:nucleoside 2-deoxyribosyltransferase